MVSRAGPNPASRAIYYYIWYYIQYIGIIVILLSYYTACIL